MIEKLFFNTRKEADIEKKTRHGIWYVKHTDFINEKIRVTFVNGDDDPNNSEKLQEYKLKLFRKKELLVKQKASTITFPEFIELQNLDIF